MAKKKRPRDVNQLAKSVVDEATGQVTSKSDDESKNPAAVELGRKGGLKGGSARASKLTKQQLIDSARKAATARWKKNQSN